ncbi:M1 family metallopeptidase [Compostibacter hankyongensis]
MNNLYRLFYRPLTILLGVTIFAGHRAQAQSQTNDSSATAVQQQSMPLLEVHAGSDPLRDYRATAERITDLVDTRLDVRFDFAKRYLYGKEWVTLQPHFYPTDSLTLDAKGMDIHRVALLKNGRQVPLKYRYDSLQLHIQLDKTYTRDQRYTLYLDYTARPDELKMSGGSAAITSSKGLYFINPDGKDPYKPTEVWTQGESESSSVWFPTIDKPNQKTTEQITMTVPDEYTTLSNGMLISQKKNNDGTRTDTWKMKHPNSPYLFMMAAGPFSIVKDHWKNIPVNYYVEKAYAPYARAIFGHTPEMIGFYSDILGVPYQWSKYAQIVGRDYVSGAMENTTATLHGEFLYQTDRQMLDDDYRNESVIAHELFHHWFGDLVTTESWSNLTVNESFADFSEMLWAEHKYGQDLADQHSYEAMQDYFDFARSGKDHPLVNFYYADKEDVFDQVTYQKGGRVLNMLRNYVGKDAFFSALHQYLEQNKFKPAEAQQLRLAFEQVTGKDLSWFWNQWYYGEGYPKLDISYRYEDDLHLVRVIVRQTQSGRVFQLPFAIDIYAGGKKERHSVMMTERADTFTYHYRVRPDLVNVDGDKTLLTEKEDHKTVSNFVYQYHHAPLYLDRLEAIEGCAKAQSSSEAARQLLLDALKDKFEGLRSAAISHLDLKDETVRPAALPLLTNLALRDPKSSVRSDALQAITGDSATLSSHDELIQQALKDSSLRVESTALDAFSAYNPQQAYQWAKQHSREAEAPLTEVICAVLARYGDAADFPYVAMNFDRNGSFQKLAYTQPYLYMLAQVITATDTVKNGLDKTKDFAQELGPRYGAYVMSMLENFVTLKTRQADAAADDSQRTALREQAGYGQQAIAHLQKTLNK